MRVFFKMADNEGAANIFILRRFELIAKKRVCLSCLAQINSPTAKLLVKIPDIAINRDRNISHETRVIFVLSLAPRKRERPG